MFVSTKTPAAVQWSPQRPDWFHGSAIWVFPKMFGFVKIPIYIMSRVTVVIATWYTFWTLPALCISLVVIMGDGKHGIFFFKLFISNLTWFVWRLSGYTGIQSFVSHSNGSQICVCWQQQQQHASLAFRNIRIWGEIVSISTTRTRWQMSPTSQSMSDSYVWYIPQVTWQPKYLWFSTKKN